MAEQRARQGRRHRRDVPEDHRPRAGDEGAGAEKTNTKSTKTTSQNSKGQRYKQRPSSQRSLLRSVRPKNSLRASCLVESLFSLSRNSLRCPAARSASLPDSESGNAKRAGWPSISTRDHPAQQVNAERAHQRVTLRFAVDEPLQRAQRIVGEANQLFARTGVTARRGTSPRPAARTRESGMPGIDLKVARHVRLHHAEQRRHHLAAFAATPQPGGAR